MKTNRFIDNLQKVVNFTSKILGKIKIIRLQFKLAELKIIMISFQLFILALGIFIIFLNRNEHISFQLMSIIVFIGIILVSIPFLSITILEFYSERDLNLINYTPKRINDRFILEEKRSIRSIKTNNKNKHINSESINENVQVSDLQKSFDKLLIALNQCDIYDKESKNFDLAGIKIEPLQSMQILCLFFLRNYVVNKNGNKKNKAKVYGLFNSYFNSHRMTSKNWKDYSEFIEFDNQIKCSIPESYHEFKNYFYHQLSIKK